MTKTTVRRGTDASVEADTGVASVSEPATVAEAYLALLRRHGVDNLYVNAGTDFAPLVEAYARSRSGTAEFPCPVVAAHENLAAGMAHGAYQVTGRPQVAMFHVSVGTANAICAVMNAARDNVPMIVTAGRTPILEDGAVGARDASIHWAQEMFDQAGMVREVVKWDYELRDSRQLENVLDRAFSIATAEPKGPVYLSLPREVLAAPHVTTPGAAEHQRAGHVASPTSPRPDRDAVELLADRLAGAAVPVIVTSATGTDPDTVERLGELCERFAIGVAEAQPRYVNVRADHPFHLGHRVGRVLADVDVACFLECDVPWIAADGAPRPDAFVAQSGVDPLFAGYPMRSHRSDLTITASARSLLDALMDALERRRDRIDLTRADHLRTRANSERERLARLAERETGGTGAISKAFMALTLADVLRDDTVVFNEYWIAPQLLGARPPGSYFYLPPSGGLGWALPAALGAKHAAPDRSVVAAVGDGAYLFANPAACHHAAQKHGLPVLTIVANNTRWGAVEFATRSVYPDGEAVRTGEDRLSDLSPSPAFEQYAEASGGYGERVDDRRELRSALDRALHAVQVEGRQALLNVICT